MGLPSQGRTGWIQNETRAEHSSGTYEDLGLSPALQEYLSREAGLLLMTQQPKDREFHLSKLRFSTTATFLSETAWCLDLCYLLQITRACRLKIGRFSHQWESYAMPASLAATVPSITLHQRHSQLFPKVKFISSSKLQSQECLCYAFNAGIFTSATNVIWHFSNCTVLQGESQQERDALQGCWASCHEGQLYRWGWQGFWDIWGSIETSAVS